MRYANYLSGIALLGGLIMTLSSNAEGTAAQPVFTVGDSWELHRIDGYSNSESSHWRLTVKELSGDLVTFNGTNKKSDYTYSRLSNYNPIKWIDKAAGTKEVREMFHWPLTPGEVWDYSYTDSEKHALTTHVAVGDWETVSTPAGTFKAIKLTLTGRWLNSSNKSGNWQEIDWYAPDARWIVRTEYKDYLSSSSKVYNWWSEELMSYKLM